MSSQFTEKQEQTPQRRIGHASDYSARVQEAMRYNRLSSSTYPLVMTILDAVLQGHTEERWKEGQQRALKVLTSQQPDKGVAHADAADRYEQTLACLKDMMLWPW